MLNENKTKKFGILQIASCLVAASTQITKATEHDTKDEAEAFAIHNYLLWGE